MHDPNTLLKQAVTQITDEINTGGLEPEAAVTKVAKDLSLNHNFIKRASEAINVALTYNHFKKHADCRDIDFPIVDAGRVIKDIFGTEQPTVNQTKSAMFSEAFLDHNVINFTRYQDPQYKKAYTDIIKCSDNNTATSYPMSEEGAVKKAFSMAASAKHYADILKVESMEAKEASLRKFASLVNYWSIGAEYRESFEEFEKQAYSVFGEDVIPYIDALYKRAGLKEERGEHDSKYTAFDECSALVKLSDFIDTSEQHQMKQAEYVELAGKYVQLKDNLDKFAKANKVKATGRFITENELIEFGKGKAKDEGKEKEEAEDKDDAKGKDGTPEHENAETPAEEKKEQEEGDDDPVREYAKKKALDLNVPVSHALEDEIKYLSIGQRSLPPALKAKIVAKKKQLMPEVKIAGNLLLDYATEGWKNEGKPSSSVPSVSPLDNLDRKLMLQELIGTDPILKGYEPKKIVDSYEQLLRIAPEMSLEKEVVRAHLRSAAASQALDSFTAGGLVDLNTKLMNQKLLAEGNKQPKFQ